MQTIEEPLKLAALLADLPATWYIAGGWALDLFLKQVTREHHDIEIAIYRDQQEIVRQYFKERNWHLDKIIPRPEGGLVVEWLDGERLERPIHQIRPRPASSKTSPFDILINEREGEEWLFRRDLSVRRPLSSVGNYTDDGIPYLRPEIVLLYKAANPRPQDEADFSFAHPFLENEQREWLYQTIQTLYPQHHWLKYLCQ